MVFPISISIYIELLKIQDPLRRRDLGKALELVGRYWVIPDRFVVGTHEMEALLDQVVGVNPNPIGQMDFLGWGVFHAIGAAGSLRVESTDGRDVTGEVRAKHPGGPVAFDQIVSEGMLELNRQVILDHTAEQSRPPESGYFLERILGRFDREAEREVELVGLLDEEPRWRRGRLRDVIPGREVAHQIGSILRRSRQERGLESLNDLFTPTGVRRAFDSMPSFDASVSLKTSLHRNAEHWWTANDVHDIDALAVALPYCDVVLTDGAMASRTVQAGLASRYGTVVLSRLSDIHGCVDLI